MEDLVLMGNDAAQKKRYVWQKFPATDVRL
jgi:hypothetical protein